MFPRIDEWSWEDVRAEAWAGRLFIHGRLTDPTTGGPLYCRVRAVQGDLVEYEVIYHRDDGSERVGDPWRPPIEHFVESTFGSWYDGTAPPPAIVRRPGGQPVPLDPRKIGGRPAGS